MMIRLFEHLEYKHIIGDVDCEHCWPSYPRICKNCGKLIHAEFGDEDKDMNYYLIYECDGCHDKYELE